MCKWHLKQTLVPTLLGSGVIELEAVILASLQVADHRPDHCLAIGVRRNEEHFEY